MDDLRSSSRVQRLTRLPRQPALEATDLLPCLRQCGFSVPARVLPQERLTASLAEIMVRFRLVYRMTDNRTLLSGKRAHALACQHSAWKLRLPCSFVHWNASATLPVITTGKVQAAQVFG